MEKVRICVQPTTRVAGEVYAEKGSRKVVMRPKSPRADANVPTVQSNDGPVYMQNSKKDLRGIICTVIRSKRMMS